MKYYSVEASNRGATNINAEVVTATIASVLADYKDVRVKISPIIEDIAARVNKTEYNKGIQLQSSNGELIVNLYIQLDKNAELERVTEQIQTSVREEVEQYVGLIVRSVNINVVGVV